MPRHLGYPILEVIEMNSDKELLQYVAKNTEMGIHSIEQLMQLVKDQEFLQVLQQQRREYQEIYDEATHKLKSHGEDLNKVSPMAKWSSYVMMHVQNWKDDSLSALAEMMMKGSNNGIIEITKHLNECDQADGDIVRLAKRLLKTEQNNVEQLKPFLGMAHAGAGSR